MALSSPPSGGRWVILGEQSRVKFREYRGADVFRMYNPLMELYLYGIGTGILLPVMVVCYAGMLHVFYKEQKESNFDVFDAFFVVPCVFFIPLAILTSLSIFVTVRFISLCVSRYA